MWLLRLLLLYFVFILFIIIIDDNDNEVRTLQARLVRTLRARGRAGGEAGGGQGKYSEPHVIFSPCPGASDIMTWCASIDSCKPA